MTFKLDEKRKAEIASFVENRFQEYRRSAFFQNWKLLCENIRDAVDMRWRPGEQMTRTGLYVAALRAARDGFREGFTDTFGQASPLFVYKPRRGVPQDRINRAQEAMDNTWEDIDGLSSWMAQMDDAVDYSMGVSYVHWERAGGEREKPVVTTQAWGDALEWQDDWDILLDQPAIERIHPFNYACDSRTGSKLSWEGCEWEYSPEHLAGFLSSPQFDRGAITRVMAKIAEGKVTGGSNTFYNTADQSGGQKPTDRIVYAKEYWGNLRGITGLERDNCEYCVTVCEGEIIRFNVNRIRAPRTWRPFNRTRLCPLNDIPIGLHILAPSLTHQRFKNLLLNLSADDVIMRQHLGLAVWPSQLKNPNDLLNPEGARGVIMMKDSANPNLVPRFFADGRSGLLQDVFSLDDRLDTTNQMAGISNQALGQSGGETQNQTATGQRFLANTANRRSRAALISAVRTGLKPIGKSIMMLTLRNKPPEDLRLSPEELREIWDNNAWEASDLVTWDQTQASSALANWGQVALQQMSGITTKEGGADHVVEYMKDLGRYMGVPAARLDVYLPKGGRPPEVGAPGQPPPGGPPQGAQPVPPKAQEAGEDPMVDSAMTDEEMQNAMA